MPHTRTCRISSDQLHLIQQGQDPDDWKPMQPRLNNVLKGKIEKCTIDRLVQMLAEVGWYVSIKVSKAA